MTDLRRKNVDWDVSPGVTTEGAILAVLMDIREELQALNGSITSQYHESIRNGMGALMQAFPAKTTRYEPQRQPQRRKPGRPRTTKGKSK